MKPSSHFQKLLSIKKADVPSGRVWL